MSKLNTRAIIDANIRQNGQQLITGQVLNSVLNSMVTDYAEQAALDAFKEKVDALSLGAFYGYFPDSSSLPVDMTTPGYAYVGLDNPYKIWNFNGKSWSDSGTSIDMNDADEEDITRNADGKLQFKDRTYGDGMGYVILRKDKTFAEQVTQANTIYEIRYDFDLNGEEITINKNCILKFEGGKIKNGSITFSGTSIQSAISYIFENIECKGRVLGPIPVEYFGTFANDSTSIDLAVSLRKIYSISNVAQLGEGRYYTKESAIEIDDSLIGTGKNSSIVEFSNIENNTTGFRFGKTTGGPENRTWNNYIAGVQIEIKDVGAIGTSVLEINNVTRSVLERINLINYNDRKSEYTVEELATPETNSNYALVLNGSSELVDISDYYFHADIPIFVKKSCDFFSLRKGYIECSNFGFAGIYGSPLGTNSEISGGLNIAQGLYGMHFTATQGDKFRTYYTNIRIEQLRGGANIYLNAQVPILDMNLKSISFSSPTKGFVIEGDKECVLFCDNIICFNADTYDLFDIKNAKAKLRCSNFLTNQVTSFENVVGATISGIGKYSVPNPFTISSKTLERNFWANTYTVKRDFIIIERPVFVQTTDYINSVLFSDFLKYDSVLLDFNVYDGDNVATIKLSLHLEDGKFTKLSIVEDKLKLSQYIQFGINADKYLDIYIKSGVTNLLYDFSGINFESSNKLFLVKPNSGPTSQRPTLTAIDEGFEYYDSTLKKKILWNGTAWTNMDGTALE